MTTQSPRPSRVRTAESVNSEATPATPLSKSEVAPFGDTPASHIANARQILGPRLAHMREHADVVARPSQLHEDLEAIERRLALAAQLLESDRKARLTAAAIAAGIHEAMHAAGAGDVVTMLAGIVTEAFRATRYLGDVDTAAATPRRAAIAEIDQSLTRIVELIETTIGTPALVRALDSSREVRTALDTCDGQADGVQ